MLLRLCHRRYSSGTHYAGGVRLRLRLGLRLGLRLRLRLGFRPFLCFLERYLERMHNGAARLSIQGNKPDDWPHGDDGRSARLRHVPHRLLWQNG